MKFRYLVNYLKFPCHMLIRYIDKNNELFVIADNTSSDFIKYNFTKIERLVDIIGDYEVKNFNKIDDDTYSILLIKE